VGAIFGQGFFDSTKSRRPERNALTKIRNLDDKMAETPRSDGAAAPGREGRFAELAQIETSSVLSFPVARPGHVQR
jgi:hypothetical protein